MLTPQPDGSTLRSHALQYEKATGKRAEELYGPEIPTWLNYLVEHFMALDQCRGFTDGGVSAISYFDIMNYQQLFGLKFSHWEIKAIKAIDTAFIQTLLERKRG